jgi:penicillin-binding protein 1A
MALYGGGDFEQEQFDLATQGRRQPGSAFKPFVLAAAFEQGLPLSLQLEGDSPAYFDEIPGWEESDDGVVNYGGSSFGRVDMREALVRSVNTAFADLILTVGHEPVIALAERMGIDAQAAFSDHDGPAIALGGIGNGITPLEMASSYAVFANAGRRATPYLIDRVTDRAGGEAFVQQPEPEVVLSPEVNAAMVDIMQQRGVPGHGHRGAAAGVACRPARPVRRRTTRTRGSWARSRSCPPRCGSATPRGRSRSAA